MTTAPPEDAIANFVSFTSTTREQAILFLKVFDTTPAIRLAGPQLTKLNFKTGKQSGLSKSY